ncbi:hypothetical protein AVEN_171918-1 [Araneus ventricosus]|uniref:Uncharacterized protein n=1 Tax=Araneus ventricosus TaxID=182803 RepID=A0A4Y2V513_ARAVE|nr:hypothetical protein AVEN_171918-1 [Araneus ventricosus]
MDLCSESSQNSYRRKRKLRRILFRRMEEVQVRIVCTFEQKGLSHIRDRKKGLLTGYYRTQLLLFIGGCFYKPVIFLVEITTDKKIMVVKRESTEDRYRFRPDDFKISFGTR